MITIIPWIENDGERKCMVNVMEAMNRYYRAGYGLLEVESHIIVGIMAYDPLFWNEVREYLYQIVDGSL